MDTYNTYRIWFFRAGLFRRSQELIYDVAEGEQAIKAKITHYIKKLRHDGEKFDETKVELVGTFQR